MAVLEGQLTAREPLTEEEQTCALAVDTSQPVDWRVVVPACWVREHWVDLGK